jgi:ABC-type transporter Mla maintaining outer membrane lipid asymmetry permease subunit MlaE
MQQLEQLREHARGRLERLGNVVTSHVWRLGFASRFLFYLVMHSGTALRRFRLTMAEIYFAGVLSLIIILVILLVLYTSFSLKTLGSSLLPPAISKMPMAITAIPAMIQM